MIATVQRSAAKPIRYGKRPLRRWPLFLAFPLMLVGVWLESERLFPPTKSAPVNPADLFSVSRGLVEKFVDASCRVISNLEVDIKCRVSGEVIQVPFDISQTVHKGDLLCQLDPTDIYLAVRSADATVAQTKARLAQTQYDLKQAEENLATTRRKNEAALASAKVKAANVQAKAGRLKDLLQREFASREDMESAQTEAAMAEAALESARIAIDELKQQEIQLQYKREAVKMAEAQLQSDQINLDLQKQQLTHATVTAPIEGVLSALNVQMGTIVASGMNGFSGGTTIMTLSDLSHVFAIATVDESDIGDVRVGQRARISVASFPGRIFAGQVVRIATKGVNASNVVTFEVKVEILDGHKDLLRPEMTGNVAIVQEEQLNVLTIPSSAVLRHGTQAVVTTADGQRRTISVGLQGNETVEVLSGLTEGEKVRVITAELPTRWKSQENSPGGGPPPSQ